MLRLILIFRRLKYPLQIQVNNCTFLITQRRRLRLRPSIWCQVSPHQSSTISKDIISSSSSKKKLWYRDQAKCSTWPATTSSSSFGRFASPDCITEFGCCLTSIPFFYCYYLAQLKRRGAANTSLNSWKLFFEAVDIPPGGLGVTSIELQCLYKQTN